MATTTRPHPTEADRHARTVPAAFPTPPLPDDLRADAVFVNLDGDYTYLGDGYYRSLEAQHEGLQAIPTAREALDAYVVPLALQKAEAAGLAVPRWEIVNDSTFGFPPPVVIYPINPWQDEGRVVDTTDQLDDAIKSLSMSGKYPMVCQELPPDSRVDTLRLVLGECLKAEYRELAEDLWRIFHLPLARVKVIVTANRYLFSAIEPLEREELTQNEKAIIKEAGLWRG